jgi:hypothetical protein
MRRFGAGGYRAVLWHQGESDTSIGTSAPIYHQKLYALIYQSQMASGTNSPWFVAIASMPGTVLFDRCGSNQACRQNILDRMNQVTTGQRAVINVSHIAQQGAITDDLLDPWRNKDDGAGVHFNSGGLHLHAQRWRDVLLPTLP